MKMKKFTLYVIGLLCLGLISLFVIRSNYTKTFLLYSALLSLIMLGSYALSYFFKQRVETTIPLYFIVAFIYLYIFGLMNQLLIGVYSFIIINIIIGIYSIIRTIIKNESKDMKTLFLTPGLVAFLLIYIVFGISSYNAAFYVWDEFNFWGIAPKNMYYLNSFYTVNGTTTYLFYPPNPSLLIYYFSKVINEYSQGIELFTMYIISFSLLLPLFKKTSFKNKIANTCLFIVLLIIPSIFCNIDFYNTIYTDVYLGLLVIYIFVILFDNDNSIFNRINFLLSLFVLILTKATGQVFAGLLIFIYIINNIINVKNKKLYFNMINKKVLSYIGLIILFICIPFISWKVYLIHNTGELNNGYFNDNSNIRSSYPLINELYGTFIDSDVEHNNSFSNYPIHLLETKYYANVPIKINGFLLLSIFIIIYIIVYTIISDKKKFLNNSLLLAIIAILYVTALQFAYYIIFSEAEAINHSSLERYIGTMCIPLLYYIFYALYTDHKIYNNKKIIVLSTAILLIFTPITPILNATILSNAHNSQLQKEVRNQKDLTEFVNYYTDKNSRIFAVHQTQFQDSILLQFRYFMTPRMIPVVSVFNDDGLIANGKFNTVDEWSNELYDRYDYVLVINSDEYFDNNFNSVFENKKVEGWTLYSIEKNEKKHSVLLKKVRTF